MQQRGFVRMRVASPAVTLDEREAQQAMDLIRGDRVLGVVGFTS